LSLRLRIHQPSHGSRGRPAHTIHAQLSVRAEVHVGETVVLEREDGDCPVGTCSGEVASRFGGRPGDEVDGGGVDCEFVDALPGGVLFAVDEDAAVVGGRGEDGAVFGVCPGEGPDGAFVSALYRVNNVGLDWLERVVVTLSVSLLSGVGRCRFRRP
jgi:hypothetical protein